MFVLTSANRGWILGKRARLRPLVALQSYRESRRKARAQLQERFPVGKRLIARGGKVGEVRWRVMSGYVGDKKTRRLGDQEWEREKLLLIQGATAERNGRAQRSDAVLDDYRRFLLGKYTISRVLST